MKRFAAALSASFLVVGLAVVASAGPSDALWKAKCSTCHGVDGKGQTTMGKKLQVKDLTAADTWKDLTDAKIETAINEGIKRDGKQVMQPFKDKLKAEEIAALVAHVKSFKPAQ